MSEVKKARQQLDVRNGIQPAGKQKKKKRRPSKGPVKARSAPPRPAAVKHPSSAEKPNPARRLPSGERVAFPVEDRQRARQAVAVKRKKRRKRNHTLYYMILALFIIVAGVILSLTVFFNIDAIEVEGSSRYTAEEIGAMSGLRLGDNLFRISTGDASDRIINAFAYVDRVEIKRSFPNKLIIAVVEAEPVMSISGGGGYYLVSAAGRILDSGLSEPGENTFIVTGVDLQGYQNGEFIRSDAGQEVETLETINSICTDLGLTNLTRIDLRSVVDIRIFVGDRFRIDIGSVSNLQYKLAFAKEVMEGRLGGSSKGVIDAKQPGSIYFRPEENLSNSSSPASDPSQSGGSNPASEPDSSQASSP